MSLRLQVDEDGFAPNSVAQPQQRNALKFRVALNAKSKIFDRAFLPPTALPSVLRGWGVK